MKWSKSVKKRGKNSPKNTQLKSCAGKNRLKFIFSYRLIVQQRQKGKELEWADEYGGFWAAHLGEKGRETRSLGGRRRYAALAPWVNLWDVVAL